MLAAAQAGAQTVSTTSATADKSRILIGEQFQLNLRAEFPESEPIRFFNIDTIPHFELLEKLKIDTQNTSEGTILTQQIRMTSFDSGQWVIPRFFLGPELSTDSIRVDVVFSEPFDPGQSYHDIKDVMDVKMEEEKEEWWWWVAGGGMLLLLLLAWVLLRKKEAKPAAPTVPVDPFAEAMEELERLRHRHEETKFYYSGMVDAFRKYLDRKKGISSLQKTTDDLVVQLKGLSLPGQLFDDLSQALRLTDFVKFAKYEPAVQDGTFVWDTIREAIRRIDQAGSNTPSPGAEKREE